VMLEIKLACLEITSALTILVAGMEAPCLLLSFMSRFCERDENLPPTSLLPMMNRKQVTSALSSLPQSLCPQECLVSFSDLLHPASPYGTMSPY
jgi:hypothetical protein